MSFFYPQLDETTIKNIEIVRQLAQAHSGYFLESRYPKSIEVLLKQWFLDQKKTMDIDMGSVPEDNRDPWDMLYSEAKALFLQLKSVRFEDVGETAEKMAYFRTATALIEKLVSLQERANGIKEVGEFHRAVLNIMESVLTPSQRTSVMDQLQSLISK